MSRVILSTPLLLKDGIYRRTTIKKEQALEWVSRGDFQNFCGHQTVRILGLQPATTREACTGYSEALCLKPIGRLDFGREYSAEEIGAIGVEFVLVTYLAD